MQTSAERLAADQVLEVVRAAIATVLERDPASVGPATTFAELDADSLALVEMAEIIEEHLAPVASPGFRLADHELEALRTVGDAVELARRAVESGTG